MQVRGLIRRSWIAVAFYTAITSHSVAQESSPPCLTLSAAIGFALAHYPAVHQSMERLSAARESVELSRTAYLPRADFLWHSNRATRNNIFGRLLPQSVIPPISGPVLSETSDRGVWGSAGGVLVAWEPFDFGYRSASVDVARATQQRVNAQLALTQLDVAARAADAFLTLASIFPKVNAFVKWIAVNRGSRVRSGELLARLEAPELVEQRAEAEAKLQQSQSPMSAAEAKLASDQSTYEHLKAAAATPGVVAGNDLVIAEKASETDRAQVKAQQENVNAARQTLASVTQTEEYLQVKASFDGIVTERNVYPGTLVGPAGAASGSSPLLKIETLSRLRLTVDVPETYAAGVPEGTKVEFTVPSFPGRTFSGQIARISYAVDIKTRTMPVELDVSNAKGELAPGTFADVCWPVRHSYPALFVPASAVATTLERVFVVRIRDNKAEWVDVKTGVSAPKLVEVFGDLQEGDKVAVRGTDELHPGTTVTTETARSN